MPITFYDTHNGGGRELAQMALSRWQAHTFTLCWGRTLEPYACWEVLFSTELPPSQMLHILAEISLLIVLLSFFPISILSKCLIEAMRTYIMTFSWNNRKIWENRFGRKKSQVGWSFSVASSHSNIWEHPVDDMLLCNSFKGCFLLPFHHHHLHHRVGRGPVHVWSEDHPWRWFFPLAGSGNHTQVIKLA